MGRKEKSSKAEVLNVFAHCLEQSGNMDPRTGSQHIEVPLRSSSCAEQKN